MNRFFSTPKWHTNYVKKINIKIDNFPLQNYKIVQLSDIHLGNRNISKMVLEDIIKKVINLNPDIVLITGDLIDARSKFNKEYLDPLKKLSQKIDCYFVFGNHEFGYFKNNISKFKSYLKELGIKILLNESTVINVKEKSYNLVGLSDYTGIFYDYPPNIKEAFRQVDNSLPTIVMVHRAGWIKNLKNQTFSLVLSGHNHGGQIAPFGIWVTKLRCKTNYIKGLYKLGKNKYAYISNGIGYSKLTFRFMAKSEIALIVLN